MRGGRGRGCRRFFAHAGIFSLATCQPEICVMAAGMSTEGVAACLQSKAAHVVATMLANETEGVLG